MGVKDFMAQKLLERQLKNLPEGQRETILKLVKQEPELFKKIAGEIKEKTSQGQDEMMASMAVMKKYQSELQQAMKKI